MSLRPATVFPRPGPSDLAIDLGTANTRVYIPGEGVVLDEPSVIAIDARDKRVLAVGRPAKAMTGRAPDNIAVISPVRHGVIADVVAAREMLEHFMRAVTGRWRVRRPRVAVVVPYGTTQVERRAVRELCGSVGARKVHLIQEPVAAALGAGLPVTAPGAHTIVNIGGGTTEVAVLSLSGIVVCESMRVGGEDLDEALIQHVRKGHSLLIGALQAEDLKLATGSGLASEAASPVREIKGRNLVTGLPKTIGVSVQELREALQEQLALFVNAVRMCLERIPPELAADVVDTGIVLTGGGALQRGLETELRSATHLPIRIGAEPSHCAVLGAGRALEKSALLTAMSVPT